MLVKVALGASVEEVEVPDTELFILPRGLLGFEEYSRFVLFQMDEPFFLLQSVDEADLGFVLIDPTLLVSEYSAKPSHEDLTLIGMQGSDELLLMSIVTVGANGQPVSANLRAPIAFDPARKIGCQAVLPESPYGVRFPLRRAEDGTLILAKRGAEGTRVTDRGGEGGTGSKPC